MAIEMPSRHGAHASDGSRISCDTGGGDADGGDGGDGSHPALLGDGAGGGGAATAAGTTTPRAPQRISLLSSAAAAVAAVESEASDRSAGNASLTEASQNRWKTALHAVKRERPLAIARRVSLVPEAFASAAFASAAFASTTFASTTFASTSEGGAAGTSSLDGTTSSLPSGLSSHAVWHLLSSRTLDAETRARVADSAGLRESPPHDAHDARDESHVGRHDDDDADTTGAQAGAKAGAKPGAQAGAKAGLPPDDDSAAVDARAAATPTGRSRTDPHAGPWRGRIELLGGLFALLLLLAHRAHRLGMLPTAASVRPSAPPPPGAPGTSAAASLDARTRRGVLVHRAPASQSFGQQPFRPPAGGGASHPDESQHESAWAAMDDVACRWSWRLPGCVAASGYLSMGEACALRPSLRNWLQCMRVTVEAECPSHCTAAHAPTPPPGSCTAAVAAALYRVANGLKVECVLDGTCPH